MVGHLFIIRASHFFSLSSLTPLNLASSPQKKRRPRNDRPENPKLEPVHLNVSTPEEVPLLRFYRVEVGRAPVNFLPLFSSMDTDSP